MSFIRRKKNQRGPNYSVGSTGPAGPSQFPIRVTGAAGSTGGSSYTGASAGASAGVSGNTGNNSSGGSSSCNGGGSAGGAGSSSYTGGGGGVGSGGATGAASVPLPNGGTITIPYTNNGWYYNITIPPMPKKEGAKVKPKDGRDGCDCVKCQSFFQFAEPNQEDGTLICWACRHGY